MGSSLTKVYTHRQFGNVGSDDDRRAPVGYLVRKAATTPYIVDAIWPEHPVVQNKARGITYRMAAVAASVLNPRVSDQKRTMKPRIEVVRGDRTDWYVLLVVGGDYGQIPSFDTGTTDSSLNKTEQAALGAAWSIEYGRRSYVDSTGKRQPTVQGIGALRAALSSV
jgi:hypothetical protein